MLPHSQTIRIPLQTASARKLICTITAPAALAPPPPSATPCELELELAALLDDIRVVDNRVVLRPVVASSSLVASSVEVGTGTSSVSKSVSKAVVGVAVGLGAASIRLASVVASAGVEKVNVLLRSSKMDDACATSVAVVV
jgi:hypothetical protein